MVAILITAVSCKKNRQENNPPAQSRKWIVTTIAGEGSAFFADGSALLAGFKAPTDVAVTKDGTVYVADVLNHRIRKIMEGRVTTFAGFGAEDTTSGVGTTAGFALPVQLTADTAGNLYTLDVHDFRIRKITPAAAVTVVAGNGIRGFADGSVAAAMFGESVGIVTDDQGNIYVSDWENKRIRKIDVWGQVTTIAGPLQFPPGGITIDKQGNLYIVDVINSHIHKITPTGDISTFAGSGTAGFRDGSAGEAQFSNNMNDIVIDDHGNLYLADDNRIRKITADGVVSTIAGSTGGYQDGDAASAKFLRPAGLGIDKQGNIYVADDFNNRIRKISFE